MSELHLHFESEICFVCQKNQTILDHYYLCGVTYTFFCSTGCLGAYYNAKHLSDRYYFELSILSIAFGNNQISQNEYFREKTLIFDEFKQETCWSFPDRRN